MTDTNWKEKAQAFLDSRKEVLEGVALEVNEDGTPAAATLKTKSAMMSGILQAMNGMSHEEMMKWVVDAVQMAGPTAAAKNAASIKMKPSAAAATIPEETKAIIGEDLNEEQLLKVTTLIENVVNTRIALDRIGLEEQFVELFAEAIEEQVAALTEKVDQYVTYAAEQWVEKNEVAIESTLKVEQAERLFAGLKALMVEANIEIPEETVDQVAEMAAQVEELQKKLDEQLDETIALATRIDEMEAVEVFREVSEGMALTETEKFKKLIEDVEIGGDRAELKKKLEIIRDAHFKESKTPAKTGINEQVEGEEPAAEEPATPPALKDERMDRLSQALSRASSTRYNFR